MTRSKDPFESAIEEESDGDGSDDGQVEIEQAPEENIGVHHQPKNKDATSHSLKMQPILSQFTEEQMSRYGCFRRCALTRRNMKKVLERITGSKNMDDSVNLVVSGIAKMFVGELGETARLVMGKWKDSGPIRPCHIRESYRWLKLQGKVPQRSIPRLFR